ncbi:MAG TPA: phage portal protein [Chloroflexota bacterium]|nr:phage portal protein [Chloroflexota bacterium]
MGAPNTLPRAANAAPELRSAADRLTLADQVRLKRYQEYLDWYNGKQWPRKRVGRANLVLNYCRAIVDKGVSYLLGQGVGFDVEAKGGVRKADAKRSEEMVYRVYEDSELEAVDIQAATNAAILGDAVYKVYWDAKRGLPRVINQDPMRFFAVWAEDDLSTLTKAHCIYPLSAEEAGRRWGREFRGGRVGVLESWTESSMEVIAGDVQVVKQANPYGFVPFVHIPNSRPANEFWGVSDLKDLIPLNQELNERFSDFADVIHFHSDPPIVFKGVSEHSSLAVGPGTVWDIPSDADVILLEWRGQQPAVFEHVDRVMRALHDVAETPKTAFGETGRLQSGVALEIELQSLIQKTMRKRAWWSGGLRRRNAMVLKIAERMGLGKFAPYRSRVLWPSLMPADQAVEVNNQVKLVEAGLRSRARAMDLLGEESPEEEIARISSEVSEAQAAAPASKEVGA